MRFSPRATLCATLLFMVVSPALLPAQKLHVPLTVQEALYPGAPTRGISRTNDPVTVGIPLPRAAGIKEVSQLGLEGASVGQFRVLGRWPTGEIQWVLVDTQASLAGGKNNNGIALTTGNGNFGGPDLARDNGPTITVNTGAATFVIRKKKFDLFDRVSVAGKELVTPGASAGLVLMGPDTTISVPPPRHLEISPAPGGNLEARRYRVAISYETVSGETQATPAVPTDLQRGTLLTVSPPAAVAHATGYYVYVSKDGDHPTLQTPQPLPLSSSWREPESGLTSNLRRPPAISGVGAGCGICKIAYTSSNDNQSTAVIEENGPARAVVKADGSHVDSAGHSYMHYTVRMFFYKGKTFVRTEVILRNADHPRSAKGDFNSAFKGFASYEARVALNLGTQRNYSIATDARPASGSLSSSSDDAYLYQAFSNNMEIEDWRLGNCVAPQNRRCIYSYVARSKTPQSRVWTYAQDGYQVVHGDRVEASGNDTKYPQGWADLSDSSGAGIELGVYQLSAYWPKSLEFVHGGDEARVGIWPDQTLFHGGGAQPYYQAWPQYSIHDLYFDFHGTRLNSPEHAFLAFQHYLLARAPADYYNRTGVFFYPLPDPRAEDNYYRSLGVTCCLPDVAPKIFRQYDWPGGGAGNQHELRWSYVRNFLQRGLTGRYLWAAHFYRFVAEQGFPRSDGFAWRDQPLDWLSHDGFPEEVASANGAMANRDWMDEEHSHWYGMTNFYFLTGDETIKDQLLDGIKDRYLNARSRANQGRFWEDRDIGEQLMSLARLYLALRAMNDPNAPKLIPIAEATLNAMVFPELNVSGFGTGDPIPGIDGSHGISRTRGMQYGCCTGDREPGLSGRVAAPFRHAILEEGMWEVAQAFGPSWPDYYKVLDLADGVSRWALSEGYRVPPGGNFNNSGFIYEIFLDHPNQTSKFYISPGPGQTNWFHFYVAGAYSGDLSWKHTFEWYLQRVNRGYPYPFAEYGSHMLQAVVDLILNPPRQRLVNVPLRAEKQADGSYRLSWTVPTGAVSYRIKYSPGKKIVDWIGFDAGSNKFIGDPNRTWAWFACADVPHLPPLASPGSSQIYVFKGDPGSDYHFAMKAYVQTEGRRRD